MKYDANGNLLWAKSEGGNGKDVAYQTSTDALGNVFIAGFFESPTITFGTSTLTNAGIGDIFIVKYDASGNFLWARGAGGTKNDNAWNITTDLQNNVYITGYYYSPTITFGPYSFTNASSSTAFSDMFVVKYDANGNLIWAKSEGSTGNDGITGITSDNFGNLYISGWFNSPSISFGTTILSNDSAGSNDIFILKYDSIGNVVWAKRAGGVDHDGGGCVTADALGNVYFTGTYNSPIITFGTDTLTNVVGSSDIFIVKYDTVGNVIWVRGAGNMNDEYICNRSTTDAMGNLQVAGYFNSSSISFGPYTLNNLGLWDIFIVKYDVFGNVLWAKCAGNNGIEYVYSIATDALDNIYLTGFYGSSSIVFDTNILTNAGGTDMFIAKLDATVVGIEDITRYSPDISFYPNPSTGIFMFEDNSNIKTVQVFNMMGELVLSQGNAKKINLQAYPKGIYVARINGLQVSRLVKE